MGKSLTERTTSGVTWSVLEGLSNQGITFLVGLVLARLLTPEEYGLVGIITIFIAVFLAVVDSGLSSALIREKNSSELDYDTAFWANVGISILMYTVLFFLAMPISIFFGNEELIDLTRVLGLLLIINAISIVQRTLMSKRLDFKTQTKVSVIASVVSGIIGIAMAFYGFGVWSLVAQQLSRQILQSLLIWVWSEWIPTLRFSYITFKRLFVFGWKLMASSMINSIWNEAYQLVIGKYYTPASLGQYTRAKQFADIFSSNLTTVVQRVTYPALAEIQDDEIRTKEAYRKLLKITMLITFLLMFGLASVSESLIYTLIGPQWNEAVVYLPLICLQLVFFPLNAINLNILLVKGRSDIYLYLEIAKKTIALIPLAIGIFVNIYWMLWASVAYGLIAYLLNSFYSGKQINYRIREQVLDILPAFLIALAVAFVSVVIGRFEMPNLTKLITQVSVGIVAALIIIRMFYYSEVKPYIEMSMSYIKKIRK